MSRLVRGFVGTLLAASVFAATATEASAIASTPFVYQIGTPLAEGVGGVTVSSCGSVYVAGTTLGKFPKQKDPFQADGFITKTDRKGKPSWTRQFGTNGREHVSAIAFSPCGGYIYVAGYTDGTFKKQTNAGGYDVFIAKYTTGGHQVWVKQYGTAGDDLATGIAVDKWGYLYVTGTTNGSFDGFMNAGGNDGFLMRVSRYGKTKWVQQFGTSEDDQMSGVAVNKAGTSVYVSGETKGAFPPFGNSGDVDAVVVSFDKSGLPTGTNQFGTASFDHALGVAVANTGEVYVTGYTGGDFPTFINAGAADAFIAQFDPALMTVWLDQFGTDAEDHAASVAVTKTGVVYVGGLTYGSFPTFVNVGGSDGFYAAYASTGVQLTLLQFGTSADEHVAGVAVAKSGDAVLAGATHGSMPGFTNAGDADAYVLDLLLV